MIHFYFVFNLVLVLQVFFVMIRIIDHCIYVCGIIVILVHVLD
jgi:hypothetical protein